MVRATDLIVRDACLTDFEQLSWLTDQFDGEEREEGHPVSPCCISFNKFMLIYAFIYLLTENAPRLAHIVQFERHRLRY